MSSLVMLITVLVVAIIAAVSLVCQDYGSVDRLATKAHQQQSMNCDEGDAMIVTIDWQRYYQQQHGSSTNANTASTSSTIPSFHIHPCSVFSNSYFQARRRFREAVAKLKTATMVTVPLVFLPITSEDSKDIDNNIDEKNEETALTMDIAILPGTSNKDNNIHVRRHHRQHHHHHEDWLIHSSGTHGVEGYAGSAIQLAYLQQRLELQQQEQETEESSSVPFIPNVLLIHAINPFGMHHFRRVNEHGVDLNRNALNQTQWLLALSTLHRAKVINAYQALDDSLFNPPYAPTLWYYHVKVWYQAFRALMRDGYAKIKMAMVAGQYHQPHGIFYGGGGGGGGGGTMEPSLLQLWQVLQDYGILPTTTTTTSPPLTTTDNNIPTLTWIDVHTGLGPSGQDTILSTNRNDESEQDMIEYHDELARLFPGSLIPPPPTTTASKSSSSSSGSSQAQQVVAGYQEAMGFIVDYVHDQWTNYYYKGASSSNDHRNTDSSNDASSSRQPQRQPQRRRRHRFIAMAQEFGTVSSLLVARAFIVENMAWRFLTPQQHAVWAQFTTRAAFYPNVKVWRAKVLQNGLRVLHQAQARYEHHDEHRHDDDDESSSNGGSPDGGEQQVDDDKVGDGNEQVKESEHTTEPLNDYHHEEHVDEQEEEEEEHQTEQARQEVFLKGNNDHQHVIEDAATTEL